LFEEEEKKRKGEEEIWFDLTEILIFPETLKYIWSFSSSPPLLFSSSNKNYG